jgi:predicted RNA-binding protein with PIN domain
MLPRPEGRLLFAFARYLTAMITVDILYNEACEHYSKTIQYVKNVLAEEGIDAVVNEINVVTEEQAKQLNFAGSPTIRINGEDIESEAEQRQGHIRGSCRVYNYKGQMYVIPHKEFIRAALKKYR